MEPSSANNRAPWRQSRCCSISSTSRSHSTFIYSPVPLSTLLRAQHIVERFILPHAELFYSTVVSNSFAQRSRSPARSSDLADEGTAATTSRELGRRIRAIRELQSDHLKIAACSRHSSSMAG